jgi:hypothetical protein
VRGEYAEVVCFPEEVNRILALGYSAQVVIPDLVRYNQERLQSANPMGPYHTWSECTAHLDSVHALYPNITTAKFSLGQTIEGRDMWAIKVSDNPTLDENEPEVFFNGLIHAREPITMEICLALLDRLTHDYGSDPQITALVNGREIFIMPIFNVDGYVYNEQTTPGGGGMWRKNRRLNAGGSYGVDLNRNFGFNWGYNNTGSSPTPSSETYRGTAAFSEPECQNVRLFCNARHLAMALNLHAYGDLEEYPWMCPPPAWGYTPDNTVFATLAQTMQQWTGFTCGPAWQVMYEMNGDASDWMYGQQTEKGKIMPFLFEVGSTGFWPAAPEVPGLIAEVLPACLYMINASSQFVPGVGITMLPVNPPIVIPPTGGVFSYTISLANAALVPQGCRVWVRVKFPNGSWGYLAGPVNVTVPARTTVSRIREQIVPGAWPWGQYQQWGFVANWGSVAAYDSSYFTWGFADGNDDLSQKNITVETTSPSTFGITASPNPFNATTVASFKLQVASQVSLKIYDTAGRLVATLVQGWMNAGEHQATFDGSRLAAGVYLARLEAGEFTGTQKVVLLK